MPAPKPVSSSYLFVGTHGHVVALKRNTGRKVWDTSLPGTGYSVVSIIYEEGQLLCASGGRVFALDPDTGDILWTNGLRGLGSGLVYLTTVNSNNTEEVMSLLAQQVADDDAAAQAASTGAIVT